MTFRRSKSIGKLVPLAVTLFTLAAGCGDDAGGARSPTDAGASGDGGEPAASGGRGSTAGEGGSGGTSDPGVAGTPAEAGAAGEASEPPLAELGWSKDFALPGINGATTSAVFSVVITGTRKLWVGGEFSHAGDVPAQNVAIWNGQRWSALGAGVSAPVKQLAATPDEDMYALVEARDDESPLRFWDGEKWSEVAAEADGTITAIDVGSDGTLYAAGYFTTIAGVAAPGIASRAPDADWQALPGDEDVLGGGGIETVKVVGEELCVGGLSDGDQVGVACLAGDTWTSRKANLALGSVHTLTVAEGTLYAGGNFMLDGVDSGGGVARWKDEAWELVGGGLLGEVGQPEVYALAVDGEKVYAAGFFALAGGTFVRHVAMWNGKKWSDLNGGLQKFMGVDFIEQPRGRTLAVDDGGQVYVGGRLTFAGAENALRIARWDGADWHGVDDPLAARLGVNGFLNAVYAAEDGNVYAAGGFEHLGGDGVALGVARFAAPEKRWYPLGAGLEQVRTLTEYDGAIYAGGAFTTSGTSSIKGIGRWDGAAWRSVGGGVTGEVSRLLSGSDGKLYVGGTFSEAGGEEARNIAAWDGTDWTALDRIGEDYEAVRALALDANDVLYAGGWFTTASGAPANNIVVWKDDAWAQLGEGVDDAVDSMLIYDGKLVIGGAFSHSGAADVPHVAAWNPDDEVWEALGGGLVSPQEFGTVLVQAMAAHGRDLYVAGLIESAGGETVSHIARFDGETWHDVEGGVDDVAEALSLAGDALWIGGTFTRAGGYGSTGIARFGLAP